MTATTDSGIIEYLKKRHAVPDDLVKNIIGVGLLVQEIVN
jgi:hypothetical protein